MTVYLIHFEQPYKHARHYLGYASDLAARLRRHQDGTGARLMEVITEAGIAWHVARTWEGDQAFEKALKLQKNSPRLCPDCQQMHWYQRTLRKAEQSHTRKGADEHDSLASRVE